LGGKRSAPSLDLFGEMARHNDEFAQARVEQTSDDVGNQWLPGYLEQRFRPVFSKRTQPGTAPCREQHRFARHHVPKHSSVRSALLT
jgi:hypothetical protein